MSSAPPSSRSWPLHWKILLGLTAGLLCGLAIHALWAPDQWARWGVQDSAAWLAEKDSPKNEAATALAAVVRFLINLNNFVGDLFIRGLRAISAPIVLFSLVVGASTLNDLKKLSRIGLKTVLIYLATTAIAISIGLCFANLISPGNFVDAQLRDALASSGSVVAENKIAAAQAPNAWQTLLNIVPLNPFESLGEGRMLQIVAFSLSVGMALTLVKEEKAKVVITFCEALMEVVIKIVGLLMKVAPYAVFALIVRVIATMGGEVLGALFFYCATVIAGLATMTFIVYPGVLYLSARIGFRRFFKAIAPAQLLAFSSSSSSATLPVTMRCADQRLGIHEEVGSFALPLGATINMDGTALYQGVAAVFICQLYGIDLSFNDQLTIVLTATLASIGTAGVPSVGIIMLVVVLQSVGLSAEVMTGGIAIIFGVDRILDMCRTTANVTGDLAVASIVAHSEKALLNEADADARRRDFESRPTDEFPPAKAEEQP